MTPIGRFAPSATGQLHLGSLVTAVASYCHIKSIGGQWLIRIEDVDFERCKPSYSSKILKDLENLGLISELPIVFQSKRMGIYDYYLQKLPSYICACTRKELSGAQIYPRKCLFHPPPKTQHDKIRLILPDIDLCFFDELQGVIWQNPQKTLGDVVIKRSNAMINYILACAVDDGLQGITHVMRGLDILPMTMAQVVIQKLLKLPTPHAFAHLPLIYNTQGQKLSKQTLATPIDTTMPSKLLFAALELLGQTPPKTLSTATPADILEYGSHHWNHNFLKKQLLAIV